MKEINEIAGSIFACVPSAGHLIAYFLDPFFKINPKALHISATQVFIQLGNKKMQSTA